MSERHADAARATNPGRPPVPTVTGQADYTVVVPMNAVLLGFTFHAQAFVLYVPIGAAVSNALTGVGGM